MSMSSSWRQATRCVKRQADKVSLRALPAHLTPFQYAAMKTGKQESMVQVEKEVSGHQNAYLTAQLSLNKLLVSRA